LCVQFGVPLASAAAFLSCAILASCNFNIDDNPVDPNTGPADRWETKRFTVAGESGVYLSRTYKNDEFQYYEELYADPDTTTMPVIEQVKRFSALGELRYIERYSISDDGTVLRVFRYTAEGELLYSKAYVYDSSGDSGKLVRWYYFGADGLASSALAYKWEEDDSGRLLAVVSFAPVSDTYSTLESKSSVSWFYLPNSKDWSLEARRGDDPWSLGSDPPNLKYPEAGRDTEVAHTLSDEVPLASVADPELADLPVPEVLDDSLDLVNYRLAWKDTDGSSLVKVEPLPGGSIFRPVSMERTDRRLGNSTVRMTLSYDAESGRISAKETYYGNMLALRIAMTYDTDGFPTSMDTTGAALLLPLKYDIT